MIKSLFLIFFVVSINTLQSSEVTLIQNEQDEQNDHQILIKEILQDNGRDKFSLHLPTYILGGKDDFKLQVSGKYRLFKKFPLFFDYSQTMFWEVYRKSLPFRDINYHPGLFYRQVIKDRYLKSIDMGFLHSSNGKDDIESRSVDQIYLRSSFYFNPEKTGVLASLETYYLFNEEETNSDIVETYGFYKLSFLFRNPLGLRHFDFSVSAFAGKKLVDFKNGAYEINLKYRFPSQSFNPDLLLQFYSGFGENLLEYKKRQDSLRLGLLFYL